MSITYQSQSHLARYLSGPAAKLYDRLATDGPLSISELVPDEMRATGALFAYGLADTRYLADGDCVIHLTLAAATAYRIGAGRRGAGA